MDTDKVLKAVKEFILLIETDKTPDESKLVSALDELALASSCCKNFKFDDRDLPDAPKLDQSEIRDTVCAKFPGFGMYNLPEDVAQNLSQTRIIIGSAHDDLQDIYRDLKEVEWKWEHNSVEDGLWHFHWGYEHHWGAHLRNLQWYLYNSKYEGSR